MRIMRGIWTLLVGIKDLLVLIFMLLFFALLYAALSMAPNPAMTTGSGALLLQLNGTLVEQPENIDPFSLIESRGDIAGEYRLRDVIRALRAAARDDSIKAVVLDLDRFVGGGQTTIADAADAVEEVRRAGKPVLAYATGYLDDSYQLAAHASEVWMNPLGAVMLTGPGGPQLYYKGFLDKIGVTANVYRVGTYKSAVEPFIRSDQSPEARAASQALADNLWQSWQDDVSGARPKARIAAYSSAPQNFVSGAGGDIAQAALAAGLVDRLGDRVAFGNRVAELAGKDDGPGSFKTVSFQRYAAANPDASGGNVGVLTVAGEIIDGQAGPGTAGGDTIADLLSTELARNRIKALVVRIDSPGGSVTAAERIRSAIVAAKAKGLPVVVSMGSVAASGGYWIATPADRIFAEPSTVTGSIGVFGIIPTFQGTLAKLGLSADGIKTTPLSGEPDLLRGTSEQFDQLVQLGVEDIYRRFVGIVAQSRKLTPQQVDAIGQGRVWAGGTARQIGLVDQFGSLDDAIAEAARRAKLDPKQANPLFIEQEPHPFEKFLRDAALSEEGGDHVVRDPWTSVARQPQRIMAQAMHDATRILGGPAIQVRCIECGGLAEPSRLSERETGGMIQFLQRALGL
ncbi:MAG: signal peptide peptidase SppA [Sphingomonadaceae bacterium]